MPPGSGRSSRRQAHVGLGAGVEPRALFHDCSGAYHAAGAEHAAVTDDRSRLDDGSGADATAVDHGAGADDDAVVDDEVVVREQVQDSVLEDLDVAADAHRPGGVADDLDAGADDRAFADDDVARELRRGKQRGRRSDGRQGSSVRPQLPHDSFLPGRFDGDRRWWRDGKVAVS